MLRLATLRGATRKCATGLVFMSARCSSHHEFHQSWNCKHAGSPEISEKNLSARMAIRSRSFSSAFGTVRPVRIFATLQFGSMAAKPFTVPSKSICSIAAGNHTVTPRIRRSKRPRFTFSWRGVTARFSRAHSQTGTCRRSASIQRVYQRRLTPTSHSHGPGGVRRH